MPPPVSRKEAEKEFGANIPETAWKEICDAFRRYGRRLDALAGTRVNENRNDTKGWRRRKSDAQGGIEAALKALNRIDLNFLSEAETNASLKRSGGRESYDALSRLGDAQDNINFLGWLVQQAEPIEREIPSAAESRMALAGDVFAALEPFGANLSNGWAIGQKPPSHADLTGFEQLAELLEIHQGDTPAATSKWLREAMARER